MLRPGGDKARDARPVSQPERSHPLTPPPAALSQVRTLCGHSSELPEPADQDTAKRADLRKQAIRRDWGRPVLTEEKTRLRKLAVETGYDARFDRFLSTPLEPWTCANAPSAMLFYGEIARAGDGTLSISGYSGPQLDHLAYMLGEHLITLGVTGTIHMLGDPRHEKDTRYPPVRWGRMGSSSPTGSRKLGGNSAATPTPWLRKPSGTLCAGPRSAI